MTEYGGDTATLTREELKINFAPSRWMVIFHNDDVTTMEFVVQVLVQIFGKADDDAYQIMMNVHEKGRAVAGIYSRDVAETKIQQTTQMARSQGFPLSLTLEEA